MEGSCEDSSSNTDMYQLPECCISHVISLTSPLEASRCAAVSTTFSSAAASNTVWDRFLPPDYPSILARAVQQVSYASKRELYSQLCDGILLDGGNSTVWLDRRSGEKCFAVSARALSLPWDDGPFCWNWIDDHPLSTRFHEVAELVDVSCLDIHGKIESQNLSPRTAYAAYLVFTTVPGHRGLSFPDQEMTITIGKQVTRSVVCLKPDKAEMEKFKHVHAWAQSEFSYFSNPRSPLQREDGWMEMQIGEFYNGELKNCDIKMSFEILGWYQKSGLVIEGIETRPIDMKKNK